MKELDHGLPLNYLKGERYRLVDQLGKIDPPTLDELREVAIIQQAIAAVEAVIIEKDRGL